MDELNLESITNGPELLEFRLREGEGGEEIVYCVDYAGACEEARDWARGGNYGEVESTIWTEVYIDAAVILDEDEDEDEDDEEEEDEEGEEDAPSWVHVGTVTVSIDPEEPSCSEARHTWRSPYSILGGLKENPGVMGCGGGVIIEEVCMGCGCSRVVNTWAQNPENGEQGLTSTRYESGEYTDEVAALRGSEETENDD